jgi:poly-beta-1,6-N-acetyl-D-glucosamine synthase
MIVVLIPAHNEADHIEAALHSLDLQSHRADRCIVVADNCSDQTAQVARGHGATEVVSVFGNQDRKSGVLNYAFSSGLLDDLGPSDFIVEMDADSMMDPEFLYWAMLGFWNRKVGAVSCAYYAKPYKGFLARLQQAEYAMERARVGRYRCVPSCLSGVTTVFRVGALQEVAEMRGRGLPGQQGQYWLSTSLTEDYELTLALQSLGYELRSPQSAIVWTDTMKNWKDLWHQRLRWQRGTLETMSLYSWRLTKRAWREQLLTYFGSLLPLVILGLWLATASAGHFRFAWAWLALLPITGFLQWLEVRQLRSWKVSLLVLSVLPLWVYGLWRSVVYWVALGKSLRGSHMSWR